MSPTPAPVPVPSNFQDKTRRILTKAPPSSRHTLTETIFFLLPLGVLWGLQKMISCVLSFLFSSRCRPPPRTTPKNPYVPHHFVNNSSGLNNKWTRMPRAIPPSKVDKIASRLATHIDGNHFFLTPAGPCFLFSCFSYGATFSPPLSTFSPSL